MRSLLSQLVAVAPELAAFILSTPLLNLPRALAVPTSAPAPNLDFSSIGQVAVAGDFDSISVYTYEGQKEGSSTNGSQSFFTLYPNGAIQDLGVVDAEIMSMCPFIQRDGTFEGVVICGNFTSIGGVKANSIALYNANATPPLTALSGLSGRCNAVYCDKDTNTVFVGGEFNGASSTNALAWTTQWVNLPFAGFNGPVNSITKNAAGNIVFAGQFDGLGNATGPKIPDQQVINLSDGTITTSGTTSISSFANASSIICSTGANSANTGAWLLEDDTVGWWEGQFGFGFIPTKLRLYNAQGDHASKAFYFEDMNSGGILNLAYEDASGTAQSCSNNCPLAQNSSAQDFHFTPTVGMNSFRIYIIDWYQTGGGLSGIELFQDDIYSFANNSYNEPRCDDVSQGSYSQANPSNGTWSSVPLSGSADAADSGYLTAYLTSDSQVNSGTNIVFQPDLKQSGNYSIQIWTPGCFQDDSCPTRGVVNITGTVTHNTPPISTTLYQSNNYGKFDQVYYGYVDATGPIRPSITLSPVPGQKVPLTVVAQKVRFELITSTGGLNGLFEYNPNQATVDSDFTNSSIDSAGASLSSLAMVNSVDSVQGTIYAAGNFSGDGMNNVIRIGGDKIPGNGLNGAVFHTYHDTSSNVLYFGGRFTATSDDSLSALNHLASFLTADNKWAALGAGVNGDVRHIVPLMLNISGSDEEDCLGVSGTFTTVNAFAGNASFDTAGFAVWVTNRNNWLHNLRDATLDVTGDLTAFTVAPGSAFYGAGQLFTQTRGSNDAVELVNSGAAFQPLGIQIRASNSSAANSTTSMRRRAATSPLSNHNYTGVYDGLYYSNSSLNITVLGGSFSATASNGTTVQNLVFVNNTANQQVVTGISSLDTDSVFTAMDVEGTMLFAGGSVSGSVNGNAVRGLVVYDLAANRFSSPQPPSLNGESVSVNSIRTQPGSQNVWVGGDFDRAGSLPCGTLCMYDASTLAWVGPGTGLTGTINAMLWASNTQLVFAGNLTVNGNKTTMGTYDVRAQTFDQYDKASTLPGTITAVSTVLGQDSQYWVSGIATENQSAYLAKYSNGNWQPAPALGVGSLVRGLQVMAVTSDHASSSLMPGNEVLLITGNLVLHGTNASAALFNGTTYSPYLLTSMADGSQGSMSGIFVSNPGGFKSHTSHHLALGLVVLIGLAIALGLIFLLVVIGILIERQRRRNEGYIPMPSNGSRDGNLHRIPPSSLLAQLGEKGSPPKL